MSDDPRHTLGPTVGFQRVGTMVTISLDFADEAEAITAARNLEEALLFGDGFELRCTGPLRASNDAKH